MAFVVLDTTVLIDVLKERPLTTERFLALESSGDVPHICAITVEEVSAWLRPNERERASVMFEGLSIAPLGVAEGRLAAWWRQRYRRSGRTLTQADALIAAAAAGIGAKLATGNLKDFPMRELEVEHWPAGQ
jgi:predicted nucleic acid-binding protein